MSNWQNRTEKQNTDPGFDLQYLTLALFLVLLAFFVVMMRFSDFDDGKVGNVLAGLADTFPQHGPASRRFVLVDPGYDEDANSLVARAEVLDMLSSQLSGWKLEGNEDSARMVLDIPQQRLIQDLSLHQDLGAAMRSVADGVSAVLTVVLDVPADQNGITLADEIGNSLEESGISPSQMATGFRIDDSSVSSDLARLTIDFRKKGGR